MGQDKINHSDPFPAYSDLMEAARHHVLRTSTAKDLRALIRRLEEACEKARVAAISALHSPVSLAEGGKSTRQNFGFARLYSALRRAKAELAAQGPGHSKGAPQKPSRRPQSVEPTASSLSAEILAQQ